VLTDSLEVSEPHLSIVVVEYSVVVAHPTISEDPGRPSEVHLNSNTAHAGARTRLYWPKTETGRRHGKVLLANSERDRRDFSGARESMEAITNGFGARDLLVERIHFVFRTNDESVTLFRLISMVNSYEDSRTDRIHNSVARLGDSGATNLDSGEFNLPESLLSNGGISGGTTVQVRIESTKGQLATRRGELESKDTTSGLTSFDEILEDRICLADADRFEAHSHYAVSWKLVPAQIISRLQAVNAPG
jgi:hypothetical protein